MPAPAPVPLTLPEPDRRALRRRALRTVRVVVRHLGPLAARRAARRPLAPDAWAAPVRRVFEALGATFVKFGQLMASSPGIFGDAVAREFRACLDTGPPVPLAAVEAAVVEAIGRPLHSAFSAFEPEPIGRASIAVVHRARLHDGRAVAVKVLRPGIETLVASDLRLIEPLLAFLARTVGVAEAGQLMRLLDGFRLQVAEELDLRNEMQAMVHHRELVARLGLELLVVPEPVPGLSGRRVVVMEFLDGVPIDDLEGIAALGVDPRPIVEAMVRAWFLTTLRDGTFHGDVHAGNLFLLRDGRVGVLDWGIVGRLDAETHHFFRRTIQAALGDEGAWDDVAAALVRAYGPALRDGLGLDEPALARFVRAVMEPMLTRPFGEASLGTFLAAIQGQVAEAEGRALQRRSWRETWRRLRRQRALHEAIFEHGALGSAFDRGTFLLGKQLLYFERYGKMFLRDVSLLEDRGFFERALAGTPPGAPASRAPAHPPERAGPVRRSAP